jgi:GTP-binding protein
VGKSSLINALLNQKLVKTAKAPGKTRSLNFIELNELIEKNNKVALPRLVDCPGYGFAKASAQEKERWRKFMEMYLKDAQSLQRVFLCVDLKVGLHSSDKVIMEMMVDTGKPFSLILTKADTIKAQSVEQKTQAIIDEVLKMGYGSLCMSLVHIVSSHTGYGIHELMCGLMHQLQ